MMRVLAKMIAAVAFTLPTVASAYPDALISRTETALVQQIRCVDRPHPALAINAMLKNRLVRYVTNDDGIYLFAPTVPLKFLGLPVRHISGFDRDRAFQTPHTRTAEPPMFLPQFLEIDVEAPAPELKKRALAAGLTEAVPNEGRLGFEVKALGRNISSIECAV
jgi:hypothetical protein